MDDLTLVESISSFAIVLVKKTTLLTSTNSGISDFFLKDAILGELAIRAAYDLILPVFLFGSIFSLSCLLLYNPRSSFLNLSAVRAQPKLSAPKGLSLAEAKIALALKAVGEEETIGKIEDRPNGAFYQLACDLSDAPESSLWGQFYQFACSLSDVPSAYLQGQSYQFACDLADAPESSLCGQFYAFASIFKPTWHEFYRQNLGKLNLDYWQWASYPEVKNICPELTLLIDLPKPKKSVREILESLATGTNLFLIGSNGKEFDFNAKFARRSPQIQQRMRQSFKQWHENACNLLGKETMQNIYAVCYSANWDKISDIVKNSADFRIKEGANWWQILNVTKKASATEVEIAYKRSIRMWHPDLNPHPEATAITALINIAYEKYRSMPQSTIKTIDPQKKRAKMNREIFHKLQDWLKPIFPR